MSQAMHDVLEAASGLDGDDRLALVRALVADLSAADQLVVLGDVADSVTQAAIETPQTFLPEAPRYIQNLFDQREHYQRQTLQLEDAAKTLFTVNRATDLAVHLVAVEHKRITHEWDNLIEAMELHTDHYPTRSESGEFAADSLAMALGVGLSWARRYAMDGEIIAHDFPQVLPKLAAGEGSIRNAALVGELLDHLDLNTANEVFNQLVAGGILTMSANGARRRALRFLRMRGLLEEPDEVRARSECGVHFTPNDLFDELTDVHVTLPAIDAARLEAVIEERARFLQENGRNELDYAGQRPPDYIGALRADALIDVVLSNAHVATVLHLNVPITPLGTSAPISSFSNHNSHHAHPAGTSTSTPMHGHYGGQPSYASGGGSGESSDGCGFAFSKAEATRTSAAPMRGVEPVAGGGLRLVPDAAGVDEFATRVGAFTAVGGNHQSAATDGGDVTNATANGHTARTDSAGTPSDNTAGFGAVEVKGVGTIPATTVEQIAHTVGTAFTIDLVNEKTWTTVASATKTYRPTAGIAKLVKNRDAHCRFPHCTRPVEVCDLDHVMPHNHGGPTTPANLQALCRHHHRAKTFGNFAVVMDADGTCLWESPTGRRWTTTPAGETTPAPPATATA